MVDSSSFFFLLERTSGMSSSCLQALFKNGCCLGRGLKVITVLHHDGGRAKERANLKHLCSRGPLTGVHNGTLFNEILKLGGHGRCVLEWWPAILGDHVECLKHGFTHVGRLALDHFERHNAERPYIHICLDSTSHPVKDQNGMACWPPQSDMKEGVGSPCTSCR